MPYAIGIDLGGTQIKAAAVRESGEVIKQVHSHTKDAPAAPKHQLSAVSGRSEAECRAEERRRSDGALANNPPLWAVEVKSVISAFQNELNEAPICLGLCAPGLASRDARTIFSMPGRMSGLEGFEWTPYLNIPSLVLNDGQAALLGEVWQGAARGVMNAFMLTLGTGVGGGILAGGHLLRGHIGRAGHLGHFCLDPDGQPDDSGMPGSLELSIGDLSVHTRTEGRYRTTKELVERVAAGDSDAERIWTRSVEKLACAVGSLINALDPELVVIGGGIANAGKLLYDPLETFLAKIEWRPDGHHVPIVPAQLGEWSGATGAAYFALKNGEP